jgi:hypothetical protein
MVEATHRHVLAAKGIQLLINTFATATKNKEFEVGDCLFANSHIFEMTMSGTNYVILSIK